MLEEYMCMGGNEVANNARVYGYAKSADCPLGWFRCIPCESVHNATNDWTFPVWSEDGEGNPVLVTPGFSDAPPYDIENVADAPWFDAQLPDLTGRFYGVYILSVEGVDGSTRSAGVSESILDGGVVGLVRHASREIRVRALLSSEGADALEYGMAWLSSALEADGCGTHGASCGAVDVSFFGYCPPALNPVALPDDISANYLASENASRALHNVTVISGPLVEQELVSSNNKHVGKIIEWTMIAGTPWVYGTTQSVPIAPSLPVVIQDVPYNLVPYPSAELTSGTVVTATNLSTNPSVETDATGWVVTSGAVAPSVIDPTPLVTAARSTELSANGVASYRGRLLGNTAVLAGTNQTAQTSLYQQVSLAGLPADTRVSFNMWAAMLLFAGASGTVLTKIQVYAQFRAGVTVLSSTVIGESVDPAEFNGRAYSLSSVPIPATADSVRVIARFEYTWSSSGTPANNSEVRMYVDALAVTVP